MPSWKPLPSKLSGDPNDIEFAMISMQLTSRDAIDAMRWVKSSSPSTPNRVGGNISYAKPFDGVFL